MKDSNAQVVSRALRQHVNFAKKIETAANALFHGSPLAETLGAACDVFIQQSENVAEMRGVPHLAIAVVGSKGQGKTWLLRQMIHSESVLAHLHSGVLAREATTKLHWIGPTTPDALSPNEEVFHWCTNEQMTDIGQPYLLLDTPGTTDANSDAAQIAKQAMALAPVKLLAVRRDQLRSATNSLISYWVEGAIVLPVITAIPTSELPGLLANNVSLDAAGESLQSDIRQLLDGLQRTAPLSKILEPILIEDFEATGTPQKAGMRFTNAIQTRLAKQSLASVSNTKQSRLAAKLRHFREEIQEILDAEAPNLADAVGHLHREADELPGQVVRSVLGSQVTLQTAVRTRLRTQLVTDTSPIWFPYRTILSVLSITQGAWDRLVLALTGSVPSIFGAMTAWAKNIRSSQNAQTEIQSGIRERLHRQIEDRLQPINRRFHGVVAGLRSDGNDSDTHVVPDVRLDGVEELQSQSVTIFERAIEGSSTSSLTLQTLGALASVAFWTMLAGPIVSIYRQYFQASYEALSYSNSQTGPFPHPTPGLIFTSILLSVIPILIFSMIVMAIFTRKRRIRTIANEILAEHHSLIKSLKTDGVLKLNFEDACLEHAEFLISVNRFQPKE